MEVLRFTELQKPPFSYREPPFSLRVSPHGATSLRSPMRFLIPSLSVFLSTACASAGGAEPVSEKNFSLADSAWNMPLMGFGMKGNDAYTDGHVFLTLPLWSSIGRNGRLGGSYLLIEPYTSLGEQGEVASSLGLSWRHLFSDEPPSALNKTGPAKFMEEGFYLGANVFVDMLDTQNDNRFWQLGIGAEIGTRYLELRGNYYLPLSDREMVQRTETTQTFTTSSTEYTTVGTGGGNGGAPFATGHQIVQDYGNLTTFATTTTRTRTVRTVTELFEEGMEGWDAEMALLVPKIDEWVDVRVLAGYFSFDNQPFGPQGFGTGNVHGWKAGIEVRPVPAILLTAMWYEDERFTGANWTVGVQIQIPLGKEWKEAFRPRRRHLVERLAEPVRRQNDAVKVGNDVEKKNTTSTSVAKVTKVVSQTPGRIVLVDDVVFVNGGSDVGNGIQAGTPAGDGTAENPVQEANDGATIAAANNASTGRVWTVYTQGGAGVSYGQDVEVNASTNFISSATIIRSPDGQTFGTGDRPLVTGRFDVRDIGYFGLRDYQISASTEGSALNMDSVRDARIFNNDITNTNGRGVDISALGGSTSRVQFSNNTIHDTPQNGMELFSSAGSTLDIILNGNTIDTTGTGVGINATRTGTFNLNGTEDNAFINIGGAFLYRQSGSPSGSFILNGASVSSGTNH